VPTSLLGTEGEDDPLKDGEHVAVTILLRPTVVGGAFPEDPVHAMGLPYRIANAPKGFPGESNLIVLVGAKIHAEWGEKFHTVTADFSRVRVSAELGVSLRQVMQLTAECLRQNLQRPGRVPIKVIWKVPPGMEDLVGGLPKKI